MTLPLTPIDPVLRITLALAQYPILRERIRARMRRRLFDSGMSDSKTFEAEVREHAIRSQVREGLTNPLLEESADTWQIRSERIRSHLTDFHFAINLPYEQFEEIVREVLMQRGAVPEDITVSFNPELAPQEMLVDQMIAIENLREDEQGAFEARLQEIKVVLIRTMVSDQMEYVSVASHWLTASDLLEIRRNKIGQGKIGGKAAGMLLARRILMDVSSEEIRKCIKIPDSYFIGADVMYGFMAYNFLMHWAGQKYKKEEQIWEEYPSVIEEYLAGDFPPDTLDHLRELLDTIGDKPIIVRSSSLLEDSFGTSFAGKYESFFCPNHRTPEENLTALTQAIIRVYASALSPHAILYRRSTNLLDYDERIAVLIQVVEGERFNQYYFPHIAGVAFSRNLYRWSPDIRREDGFLRLVWGLGTRAVDRVGDDYPRLVALSHPFLRPEASPQEIKKYSQKYVDVLNLEENEFVTLPVHEVLHRHYPVLRYLIQVDEGGYLAPIRSNMFDGEISQMVITFEGLLRRTPFAGHMRKILNTLETHYHTPVDVEFTARVRHGDAPDSEVEISILQCRPQSELQDIKVAIPGDLRDQDIVFSTQRMVPYGIVENVRYVMFVVPERYFSLPSLSERGELVRLINHINKSLSDQVFICVGPGRWGTTNPDLGLHVNYGDIYNTRALVEITGHGFGSMPEPSYGTHFFQDLVEANIFPLAINLDDMEGALFNRDFFYRTPNCLNQIVPNTETHMENLRLIDVESFRPECTLDLIMDGEKSTATALLRPKNRIVFNPKLVEKGETEG